MLFSRVSLEKLILNASPICRDRQSLNLPVMEKSILGGEVGVTGHPVFHNVGLAREGLGILHMC